MTLQDLGFTDNLIDCLNENNLSNISVGRVTQEHRELFVLENGGIIIDTPGIRELGMTDNAEGIKSTFEEIFKISLKCKFPDCKHVNETGCSVIEALNNGVIDNDSYNNYRRIQNEQER